MKTISTYLKQAFYAITIFSFINAVFMPPTKAAPEAQAGMQQFANIPMPTEEELQAAASFLDDFFNNMSDDEMADFMDFYEGFAKDVESGKINLDDMFGPMPPQPPAPAKKEPKSRPLPEIKTEETKESLRSKKETERMIQNIVDSLHSVQLKAASSHKVMTILEPLSKDISSLLYFLHAAAKKEHIEQLITNEDLLPLHDALKELRDVLVKQEPSVQVREFGLGPENPTQKEKSKQALKTIIQALEKAFTKDKVLAAFESLFKKHEPEILKQQESAKAAEERAKKELEELKGMRTAPLRSGREPKSRSYPQRYDNRNRGYSGGYDRAPSGRNSYSSPSYQQPRAHNNNTRSASGGLPPAPTSSPLPTSTNGNQAAPGQQKEQSTIAKDKKEKESNVKSDPAIDRNKVIVDVKLDDLKEAINDSNKNAKKINDTINGTFYEYLTQPSIEKETAKAVNTSLKKATEHLKDAKKYKESADKKIKEVGTTQDIQNMRSNALRAPQELQSLYDLSFNALKNKTLSAAIYNLHMGQGDDALTENNVLDEFQTIYESVHNPQQKTERIRLMNELVQSLSDTNE